MFRFFTFNQPRGKPGEINIPGLPNNSHLTWDLHYAIVDYTGEGDFLGSLISFDQIKSLKQKKHLRDFLWVYRGMIDNARIGFVTVTVCWAGRRQFYHTKGFRRVCIQLENIGILSFYSRNDAWHLIGGTVMISYWFFFKFFDVFLIRLMVSS